MAQSTQNPSSQQQKVIITNNHGNKLVGILHEAGTKEIVILCHGLRASKEDIIMTQLTAALENAGISSFRFDFTGNGESEGSFEFGNYWREVDDIHSVAQHFHEANRRVMAIVGHSKGANVVLLYASKYHDIKTVANLSGRYDLKAGLEDRLGKDFIERIRKEGFIELKTKSDTIIPVGDALEFAKILPNHKLHIVKGADHVYTEHLAELASIVVNFLKETFAKGRG
ncbi:hypothetical protein TSUD_205910 [Trifolium subterraneum]|uniref:Serine aminopeptidase S33 domain-containing protein n=1 Tax=Trifolium subterraneum TaxID=3900 RepID=A0A2Z6NXK1_TRISU|nr:hypothetical protein TSUD_205910 [Trifolium subterraneum]